MKSSRRSAGRDLGGGGGGVSGRSGSWRGWLAGVDRGFGATGLDERGAEEVEEATKGRRRSFGGAAGEGDAARRRGVASGAGGFIMLFD
jgi:hypothetical protein